MGAIDPLLLPIITKFTVMGANAWVKAIFAVAELRAWLESPE
jgi:hypothetical protein